MEPAKDALNKVADLKEEPKPHKAYFEFGTDIFQQFAPIPYVNYTFRARPRYALSTHFTISPDIDRLMQAIEEGSNSVILPQFTLWPSISGSVDENVSIGAGLKFHNENLDFSWEGVSCGVEWHPTDKDMKKKFVSSVNVSNSLENSINELTGRKEKKQQINCEVLGRYLLQPDLHVAGRMVIRDLKRVKLGVGARWWPWWRSSTTTPVFPSFSASSDFSSIPNTHAVSGPYVTAKIDTDLDFDAAMSIPLSKEAWGVSARLSLSCGMRLTTCRPSCSIELAFGYLGFGYGSNGWTVVGQSVNEFQDVLAQIAEIENARSHDSDIDD